jgi:hypothetical protein
VPRWSSGRGTLAAPPLLRGLVGLDVLEAVQDGVAALEVDWAMASMAPALERAGAELPASREVKRS